MPEWWGSFLAAVLAIILLIVLIFGLRKMANDVRGSTRRFKIALILSLLVVPAMFSTCATINLTSEDKDVDGFGFQRPVPIDMPERRFETRRIRRETSNRNILQYVFSAHGAVSMATAIVVGILFMVLIGKIGKREGPVSCIDGYWQVFVPLAIGFLVLWNLAELYRYGSNGGEMPANVQPTNVQPANERSAPPPPTAPEPPRVKQSPSPKPQEQCRRAS